jgi:putative transposase
MYTKIRISHDFGEVTVRQQLPEQAFEHGISFSRCKRGKYFLRYHLHKTKKELPALCRPAEREVIGLDPGVRSFMTRYDADSGAHYEYSLEKLFVLADKARSLVQRVSELRKNWKQQNGAADVSLHINTPVLDLGTHEGIERIKQYNYGGAKKEATKRRRAAMRAIRKLNAEKLKALERVSNFRSNFHKQVAAHLCAEEGRTILLPEFRTSQMVAREHPETGAKRKLRQDTARNMLTLAHYKFRSYMKHKALMSGCELVIVTEEYTTMTCGGCGHLNRFVGGKKVFKCNSADCYIKEHPDDFKYLERCGQEKDLHV